MKTLRIPIVLFAALVLAAPAGVAKNGGGLPPGHPLLARLAASRVERGREFRALHVTPIAAEVSDADGTKRARTAMEAKAKENLSVGEPEVKPGRETVEIFNWSTDPVLLLAGEILVGGERDRYLARDVLLGPGRKAVAPVRPAGDRPPDEERSRVLAPYGAIVPAGLREVGITLGPPAQAVARLDSLLARLGEKPERRSVTALFATKTPAERRAEYESIFEAIPDEAGKRTIGAAVRVGERLVAIDLFETNEAFRAHWPALLRTFAAEAAQYEASYHLLDRPFPAGRDPDRHRDEFIEIRNRIFAADAKREDGVGLGDEFLFSREGVTGRALVSEDELVHAAILYDDPRGAPEPPPPPEGSSGEQSRGELERRAARGTLTEEERRILDRMRERDRGPGNPGGGPAPERGPGPGDDLPLPGAK